LKTIFNRLSQDHKSSDIRICLEYVFGKAASTPNANELIKWLGAFSADNNIKPYFLQGEHPIDIAIKANTNSNLMPLIDLFVKPEKRVLSSFIEEAIRNKNNEALIILLDNQVHEKIGNQPLMRWAIEADNIEAIKILIKKGICSANAPVQGRAPLSEAIILSNFEAIRTLLSLGADPNLPKPFSKDAQISVTPMDYLARYVSPEIRMKILKIFAECGIKVNADFATRIKRNGKPPVLFISELVDIQDIETIKYLKEELGFNLDQIVAYTSVREKKGTLVHIAIDNRKLESFKGLVELGANLNVYADGKTPLDLITSDPSYDGFRDYLRSLING
jgi:ankyrin repeat protein